MEVPCQRSDGSDAPGRRRRGAGAAAQAGAVVWLDMEEAAGGPACGGRPARLFEPDATFQVAYPEGSSRLRPLWAALAALWLLLSLAVLSWQTSPGSWLVTKLVLADGTPRLSSAPPPGASAGASGASLLAPGRGGGAELAASATPEVARPEAFSCFTAWPLASASALWAEYCLKEGPKAWVMPVNCSYVWFQYGGASLAQLQLAALTRCAERSGRPCALFDSNGAGCWPGSGGPLAQTRAEGPPSAGRGPAASPPRSGSPQSALPGAGQTAVEAESAGGSPEPLLAEPRGGPAPGSPSIPPDFSRVGLEPVRIIVDTNVAFQQFGLQHYRALESLLVQYPAAKIELLRISTSASNRGYQHGDSLPNNILQKYGRMGYKILVRLLNGRSKPAVLSLTPSTPGNAWWSLYGTKLATAEPPQAYQRLPSPEVADRTARLALRLILLRQSIMQTGFAIVSDLTVALTKRTPPGFWMVDPRPNAAPAEQAVLQVGSGARRPGSEAARQDLADLLVPSPALMAAGKAQRKAVECALRQFDAAAETGRRTPEAHALHACLKIASLESAVGLGIAADKAGDGVLEPIRQMVRSGAPDSGFVKRWLSSSSTKPLSNPWDNPFALGSKDILIPGVEVQTGQNGSMPMTGNVSSQKSCPALMIPGYMKAGSTAFYEMLVQHPMVLSQQKGPHGFSEGELYHQYSKSDRYLWTPMIEHGEPFLWFDVGLYYGEKNEGKVLADLQHDCVRTPKVLWLLREPISMLISTFRFMGGRGLRRVFNQFQDYVDYVQLSPSNHRVGGYFALSRMDQLLDEPPRWKKLLPPGTTHAVTIEEWGSHPEPSIYKAFRLMGIPEDEVQIAIKKSTSMQSSQEVDICNSSFTWLAEHFLQRKLSVVKAVGKNFTGWFPPRPPHGVVVRENC